MRLSERLVQAAVAAFGPDMADVQPLVAPATHPQFGDYQANLAMPLAKRLGKRPHDIAKALLEHARLDDLASHASIAGPGFINITLKPECLTDLAAAIWADPRLGVAPAADPQTTVVDYSGPNVAKEMHVGHLRSTVIGDALARTLGFLGHRVIRQNHLGDWGTQFGMLIEHVIDRGWEQGAGPAGIPIRDLNAFYQQAKAKFDADPDFAESSRKRVVLLQGGDPRTLAVWKYLVDESEKHFAEVYRRLNVLLTHDDIRAESSYNGALAEVVDDFVGAKLTSVSDGATCVFLDEFQREDGAPLPLIIKKADGGYLYATTDLAAVKHRIQALKAHRVIYVTDARQKQHFAMVFKAAEKAGWKGTASLEHVPFGTILGEDGKPFKTRSGDTVKLVDLLDEAEERALELVRQKNPDLSAHEQQHIARVAGIGAIKYADLCNDRVKDYVFSWQRMLALDGNSAPYLQYAYARIRSIFRKAGIDPSPAAASGLGEFRIEHPAEKALLLKAAQFNAVVHSVAASLEPHRLCTWLFELAAAFSGFYENCPVLTAPDQATRRSRLGLCGLAARALQQGLELLGIQTLEQM
jgi:arginyl-tRNA synthetase